MFTLLRFLLETPPISTDQKLCHNNNVVSRRHEGFFLALFKPSLPFSGLTIRLNSLPRRRRPAFPVQKAELSYSPIKKRIFFHSLAWTGISLNIPLQSTSSRSTTPLNRPSPSGRGSGPLTSSLSPDAGFWKSRSISSRP